MDRIWNRAEDKNSANIIVYAKASDTKAYSDEACTMQCTTSELKNAFMKGCIVVIGSSDVYYPISLSIASSTKIATLTYAKSGSTAGTAATATLVSVAD